MRLSRRLSSRRVFSRRTVLAAALALTGSAFLPHVAHADTRDHFKIAWTIYVGWMPWDYAAQSGIMKKWADKYGITIDVVQVNDYVESINQYTAGGFDACVMTNMDALTIPAAGGVDSTALIVGDFSNGNDGVVLKDKTSVADLKGQKVNLVQFSVSHYLLARALENAGLSERDVTVVNTSDADIVGAFKAPDVKAAVTWNPLLSEISAMPGAHQVFDSRKIPGEIIDLTVVNSATLKDNPKLGKALTGAWYEIMALMAKNDLASKTAMAKASGTDNAGFDAQLASTQLYTSPADAVGFTRSASLPSTMKKVAEFSFSHGLLGEGAKNAESVGMSFPGGVHYGNTANVKLRFDDSYMQLAADGKL